MQKITAQYRGNLVEILLDDDDFNALPMDARIYVHKHRASYYAQLYDKKTKKVTLFHRFILGLTDKSKVVDHADGNGLNNQRSNLRICSNSENVRNRRVDTDQTKKSTSKYKGVYWNKRSAKWHARITYDNRKIHLGLHENENEAAKAYNDAAVKYFGEFARLNEVLT